MPRKCALNSLLEWENGSKFADTILDQQAAKRALSSPDRALAMELFYGVLRNLLLLDQLIDQLRRGKIKHQTQCLLRIGLYQLFKTKIPEHAAIHETVSIARKHEKGFVNAILRNAQRSFSELENDIATWPDSVRLSHPEFLIERWTSQYGEDVARQICEWNNQAPQNYARIHSSGADEAQLNRVRSATQPCLIGPEHPDFFKLDGAPDQEWLAEGLIYVQDPATALACRLLNPQPGETILDACAAPGGKTALMAQMMENSGILIASDNAPKRAEQLRENLLRLRVTCADVKQIDWLDPKPEDLSGLPLFDAILLDVPCSNTGVMRRRVDLRWRLQEWDFAKQAETQSALLENCSKALKPGGRIVYSTCSLDQEENEAIVEKSGLRIETSIRSLPWEDGFDGAFACLLHP